MLQSRSKYGILRFVNIKLMVIKNIIGKRTAWAATELLYFDSPSIDPFISFN